MTNVKSMWKHFLTVNKHRWVVFNECRQSGITWQGIIHDMSKFSLQEFCASAKYFQGNKSPIEQEKDSVGYSVAWLHHKGHNKHHWEWWVDFDKDGKIIANQIPVKYVIEMVCDWIGAGKVYNKDKWTQEEPLNYYNKVRSGRYFHPETEELLVRLLTIIKEKGLDEFHKVCKALIEQSKGK